jgi:tripartite-type tricarboxylate transporter receptor subunit TctC
MISADAHAFFGERPISIYVPFSVGGPADIVARQIEFAIESKSNLKVAIINQGGASGNIGMRYFVNSQKAMLFTSENIIMNREYLTDSYPHAILEQAVPVYFFANSPFIIFSNPKIKSLDELIQLSKQRHILFGSSVPGSGSYEAYKLLCQIHKILEKCQRVGYQSVGNALLDLSAAYIDVYASLYANYEQFTALGLNTLVVLDNKKFDQLGQTPSMADVGFNIQLNNMYGLFHKGLTETEVNVIRDCINQYFDKSKVRNLGYNLYDPQPETFWQQQIKKYLSK